MDIDNIKYKVVSSDEDINELSILAAFIWNRYYPEIIGQKQVDYMLGKFYSEESLKNQIRRESHIFIGAYIRNKMEGFISYSKTTDEDFVIHKIYINPEIHRKGIGKRLLDHVFGKSNFKTIRLTVNRQNYKAINFYFKNGFIIEKCIDMDIGEGFVMNDFVMLLSHV